MLIGIDSKEKEIEYADEQEVLYANNKKIKKWRLNYSKRIVIIIFVDHLTIYEFIIYQKLYEIVFI